MRFSPLARVFELREKQINLLLTPLHLGLIYYVPSSGAAPITALGQKNVALEIMGRYSSLELETALRGAYLMID